MFSTDNPKVAKPVDESDDAFVIIVIAFLFAWKWCKIKRI